MSDNSFGRLFRFTTWGESHGPAIGAVIDGCPPGLALSEADIQPWLDSRRPGLSRHTSPRTEPPSLAMTRTSVALMCATAGDGVRRIVSISG